MTWCAETNPLVPVAETGRNASILHLQRPFRFLVCRRSLSGGLSPVAVDPTDAEHETSFVMEVPSSGANDVAFKIKTTAPNRYAVSPPMGILRPGAPVVITG